MGRHRRLGAGIWARGDHPAAQRLARRFGHVGVRAGRRQWQLLAPLRAGDPPARQAVRPRPPADAAEHAALAALWHRRAAGKSSRAVLRR